MTLRAFALSLILHIVLLGLLIVSFDFPRRELAIPPQDIMKAIAVDSRQVDREIARLRDIEQQKQQAERKKEQELERKVRELEAKAHAAERQRTEEEQRLAELSARKEKERQEADAEQKRVEELRKQKEELEKKQQAEEVARKKKEADEAAKRKQAEEQKAMEAAQAAKDRGIVNEYIGRITRAVQAKYYLTRTDFPERLVCTLAIRLTPGGEVISVAIRSSSGNPVFDERAKSAVYGASPLPVPDDARVFEKFFREINFVFEP
jgi:colicin import membrane protein